MKPHKNHSFSRINVFADQCERRYAFDALDPEPWGSPAADRGSHVHAGLEALAPYIGTGNPSPVDCVCALNHDKALPGRDVPYVLKPEEFRSYMDRMAPLYEDIVPARKAGINGAVRVEEWFRECAGLPIVGKMDLVSATFPVIEDRKIVDSFEAVTVVDYKTTGNPARIPSMYQARHSLQLQIYCLALGARRAGFVYLLPTGDPVPIFVEFSEADLARARKWLTCTLATIEKRWEGGTQDLSGFSLAAPGHPLCCEKWCRHWAKCLGKTE